MKIEQVYTLVNSVSSELIGDSVILKEDLSNVVDLGAAIIGTDNVDGYVKKIVNKIGLTIFSSDKYIGTVPSLIKLSWDYGSILEKISCELFDASENSSHDLQDGSDYSPNIFYQPKVNAKFFNSQVTFEVPVSFTRLQAEQSFSSAQNLNAFLSMIMLSVENSLTIKLDALAMRTVNNFIAEVGHHNLFNGTSIDQNNSTPQAVNLLKKYNEAKGQNLTVDTCLTNSDFIAFSTYIISTYINRIKTPSNLFNIEGVTKFTNESNIKLILHSDFSSAHNAFTLTNAYNRDSIQLPPHDKVPFFQGSGLNYDFTDTSKIDVTTSSGKDVVLTGLIGAMFDYNACGVCNLNQRTTTNFNPKAEFYTNFNKVDAGFFNDLGENFIIFFVA